LVKIGTKMYLIRFLLSLALFLPTFLFANSTNKQVTLVTTVKKSVVGVGLYNPLNAPRFQLRGTGFAIRNLGSKTLIATNHHVVNGEGFDDAKSQISVHVGEGKHARYYTAKLMKQNERADVAIIEVDTRLPVLKLVNASHKSPAGTEIIQAGLPIGSVLGLYKSVHKGIVSAYVPMAIPQQNASQLTIEVIKQLRNPLFVYQLDVTAYPGNSGSPIVDVSTGKVIAILNSVLVKKTKEHVLSDPSGISYAIPAKEIHNLLK